MKRILTSLTAILLAILMMASVAMAEGTDGEKYRTDATEEDFIGTWSLKYMIMEGYTVPTQQLGMQATIVITPGEIEITDVLGVTKTYETTFGEGLISFTNEQDEKMVIYITEEGLLHAELEAETYAGTTEDEESPITKKGGGAINIADMGNSFLSQYFEKVEE